MYVFIYLAVLDLSCGMEDLILDQGWNLGLLCWEHGVLATGPPGKSQGQDFITTLIHSKFNQH